MDQQETSFIVYDSIVVPEPALLKRERSNRYGSVEDLPDEELADPDELERVVFKEMWWPILSLPQQQWECPIRPNMDEDGRIEWGAFGTVDFDIYRPGFDKLRYKVAKLREKLQDLVFMLKMVSARIPGKNKLEILKLAGAGVLDIGDIVDCKMYFLAEMYLAISAASSGRSCSVVAFLRSVRRPWSSFLDIWRSRYRSAMLCLMSGRTCLVGRE